MAWADTQHTLVHHVAAQNFWLPVGGVLGREAPAPEPAPPFESELFRIEKLHMRVSSTDMRAPELSNSPQ